jgi:hypothetical protein
MRKIFLTLFAALVTSSPANANCQVGKLLEFKITMQGSRTAWSLYGRGVARRHKIDPAGQSDLNAALAIDPTLASRAQTLGIN